jgi:Protein of unknown function (DUF3348)
MLRETPPAPTAVSMGLNGPALPGLLARLGLAERPAAPPSFVDGLGRWLGWKDAIPLSAVLQAPARAPARRAAPAAVAALERELAQVQATLTQAITDDAELAQEDGGSFLPFRRRCHALQQAMDAAVGPLRTRARSAAAHAAPQLAALDAVLAGAVGPHESALLAQLPALLDKHFTRLRPAQPAPNDTTWLATFRHDMQRLLLAELELRLQPTLGLLDTLREPTTEPS